MSSAADKVAEADIETLERDGVVCLRGLVGEDWLERLRAATEAEMADPGPMVLDLTRGEGGRFFGNTFVWKHRDEFRRFVYESGMADVAAKLMRSAKVNLFFDQLLVKEPGTGAETYWHHDQPYWPVAGRQVLSMWVALDEVTKESGAVEYLAGSHLWGQRFKAKSFTGDARYTEDLPPVPDIEAERERHRFVQYALSPGDCTFHYGLTLHAAPGNSRTDRRRRAYIVRWAGDDAAYDPREGIQPMLADPGLAPGDPLDSELFPVVVNAPAIGPATAIC